MKPFPIVEKNIELLADKIVASEHFIVFTGAGISTEKRVSRCSLLLTE